MVKRNELKKVLKKGEQILYELKNEYVNKKEK